MTTIGHNGGPTMEPGYGWRRHAWGRARKALLPNTIPLEIVCQRVKRAQELGLEYKTYASIRAASGHDVVAFLFSGNALELRANRVKLKGPVAVRLRQIDGKAGRLAAIYAPAHPDAMITANSGLIEYAAPAPEFTESWSASREKLGRMLRDAGARPAGTVLVSATAIENEWCAAAKMAGIVPAETFFANDPG